MGEQNHARGVAGGLKTQRLEHGSEQRGVLKTVAAATGADRLVLHAVRVETHRPA
jgi:hypothetical protein